MSRTSSPFSHAPWPNAVCTVCTPPRSGKTARPVTVAWIDRDRDPSSTRSPTARPRSSIVSLPRATSPGPDGARPSITVGPRSSEPAASATAATPLPSTTTRPVVAYRKRATPFFRNHGVALRGMKASYPAPLMATASEFHPNRDVSDSRSRRFPANTTAVTRTRTAPMSATSVDRVGTAVRPRPGSSACRAPSTIGSGRPLRASHDADARRVQRGRSGDGLRRGPTERPRGEGSAQHEQRGESDPHHQPVDIDARGRLDRPGTARSGTRATRGPR